MNLKPTALACLPLTALLLGPLLGEGSPRPDSPGPYAVATSGSQAWSLAWDDSLDAELDFHDTRCDLRLDLIDGRVTGAFAGPVFGQTRQAIFTGELLGERDRPMLLLQQREPGYACSYQLLSAGPHRWTGTWADTKGRSGTAELTDPNLGAPRTTTAPALRDGSCLPLMPTIR